MPATEARPDRRLPTAPRCRDQREQAARQRGPKPRPTEATMRSGQAIVPTVEIGIGQAQLPSSTVPPSAGQPRATRRDPREVHRPPRSPQIKCSPVRLNRCIARRPPQPRPGTATPCALASDCASTGHVWITVWRQHGLNPFRIFSLPIESMAYGLVTGAWPPGSPGMSPGIAPPSGRIAQFIHKPCTQPTLMT